MDYYSILGVSRNASDKDLKSAYKKASMKHHPDRGGNEEEFKKVNEAYSTLKDPQKRAVYDNPQPQHNFNSSLALIYKTIHQLLSLKSRAGG